MHFSQLKQIIKPSRRFLSNSAGNVAMIFALAVMPLGLMTGFGVDLSRQHSARVAAQSSIDAAVLAAAASKATDPAAVETIIRDYLKANLGNDISAGYDVSVDYATGASTIKASLKGGVQPFFGSLIGINSMPIDVTAAAARGAGDIVEVALVLDNTYSMSGDAGNGQTRIDALKDAAKLLVDEIMTDPDGSVRISIVPYSEYMNVGAANRNQPWLDVPADETRVVPAHDWVETVCTTPVYKTCTSNIDGIVTTYQCVDKAASAGCAITTHHNPETTQLWTWWGCVGSRFEGDLRLDDSEPAKPYPGFLNVWKQCLNPILPLTADKSDLDNAIDSLVVSEGSYKPNTFIPGGMIWGVNVLSPTAPFTEGGPYDPKRRKIIVLMSDGANTMKYRQVDGTHYNFLGTQWETPDRQATDADTQAICSYAKGKGMEIYTVGFAVPAGPSLDVMRDCASNPAQAFNANDPAALAAAFRNIATAINSVRLIE